ncbi:MAG: GNAT family N-acetyltransferase [Candidatus Amesbacteria bacterium]|nr:GNAT family N-acetyltransferase [Candidatus Amesbacteria bacterium]
MIRTKPFSDADIARLWEIEKDPLVSQKMPGKIKDEKDLDVWLSENIVYGICDLQNNIIGFVQLYEVGKNLSKRLKINTNKLYEISFALPEKYRYTAGLVSTAVREICALFPKFQIVGFVHPDNLKSVRVLEKSGFTYLSKTKYHGNDRHENLVYIKSSTSEVKDYNI